MTPSEKDSSEDMEKLIKLQAAAEELYMQHAEKIAQKCYDTELIYFIRDVVKVRVPVGSVNVRCV